MRNLGWNRKRDAAEAGIIDVLEACGWSVSRLSLKGGPDLLLGRAGITVLAECKSGTERLNDEQTAWHLAWNGSPVVVLRSAEEAANLSIQQSQALAGQAAEQKLQTRKSASKGL